MNTFFKPSYPTWESREGKNMRSKIDFICIERLRKRIVDKSVMREIMNGQSDSHTIIMQVKLQQKWINNRKKK